MTLIIVNLKKKIQITKYLLILFLTVKFNIYYIKHFTYDERLFAHIAGIEY